VAVEVAAGLRGAFGFEFALGFAASVPKSIGGCHSLGKLPRSLLARPANILHSMSRSGVMQVPRMWLRGQIRPYRGSGRPAEFPPVKVLK
jgi:hypothetical protein